ncbi:hypothetical protein TRIATDRAFT_301435, partial [Trichoderma atroviride IMI 206040]
MMGRYFVLTRRASGLWRKRNGTSRRLSKRARAPGLCCASCVRGCGCVCARGCCWDWLGCRVTEKRREKKKMCRGLEALRLQVGRSRMA